MTLSLLLSLDILLQDSWDKAAHYHLTSQQRRVLLSRPLLQWEKCVFQRGTRYGPMKNERAELALVMGGAIIHEIGGKTYEQREDDLLVIPAGFEHTAAIGQDKDCTAYAYYKK